MFVDFVAPSGAVLTVGVGRPTSALSYQASDDPPYWGSIGNLPDEPDDSFSYGGSYTDLPPDRYVAKEAAWAAAEEFMHTGTRPQNVEWRKV